MKQKLLRKVESMQEEVIITRFGHALAKIVPFAQEDLAIRQYHPGDYPFAKP